MKKKRLTLSVIVILLIALIFLAFYDPLVPFSTKTKLTAQPFEEWELAKTIDGNLISTRKNHLLNSVNDFSVTEFQRGDAVTFKINDAILEKEIVNKGDTIGFVYSNEEQLRLIQLKGEISVLYSELEFHTTGQKPEDVLYAKRNLELALQQLETQKKLMSRSNELIQNQIISKEQYDIDLNELKVKELNVELAKANLASVDTGEKPEMAKLIRSKIDALSWEIEQLQNRISYFTITAPISGKIVMNHASLMSFSESNPKESIIKIVDDSKMIGIMPLRLKHSYVISSGDLVKFSKINCDGRIIRTNNTAQFSVSAPYIFFVVEILKCPSFIVGETHDVIVQGSKIPLSDFLMLHLKF